MIGLKGRSVTDPNAPCPPVVSAIWTDSNGKEKAEEAKTAQSTLLFFGLRLMYRTQVCRY
jgi:hypothetical protein